MDRGGEIGEYWAPDSPDAAQDVVDAAQVDTGTQLMDVAPIPHEAGDASASEGGCQLGNVGSIATDQDPNLFGDIVYFVKGQVLPRGRYRATYQDGCMKFNSFFTEWTVNASSVDGWFLVRETSSERVAILPGIATEARARTFEECVVASHTLPPMEFDFTGGKLGVWLNDSFYGDNQAGVDGRNPRWALELLIDACPPNLVLF